MKINKNTINYILYFIHKKKLTEDIKNGDEEYIENFNNFILTFHKTINDEKYQGLHTDKKSGKIEACMTKLYNKIFQKNDNNKK
jgi:hypothetical protein